MFTSKLKERNSKLIEAAFHLHSNGVLTANTYLIDIDAVAANAKAIITAGKERGFTILGMTKQFGRNPIVCETLKNEGIDGFVAVDPWEAITLAKGGYKLGHVGHIVQLPKALIKPILQHKPSYVTVYSKGNAAAIQNIAKELNIQQDILLRIDDGNAIYPGQEGGVTPCQLMDTLKEILNMPNLRIAGVTAFPSVLYKDGKFQFTPKAEAMRGAIKLLKGEGVQLDVINVPSANCCATMEMVAEFGGNMIEPGHAFTGSTPIHADDSAQPEIPSILYLTEVSHTDGQHSYAYGGGNYPRGNVKHAFAGSSFDELISSRYDFAFPPGGNIDYYAKVANAQLATGTPVIAAFRTQIFVTHAYVAVVSGVSSGEVKLEGIFNNLGDKIS